VAQIFFGGDRRLRLSRACQEQATLLTGGAKQNRGPGSSLSRGGHVEGTEAMATGGQERPAARAACRTATTTMSRSSAAL
jgi:hypothetical protein